MTDAADLAGLIGSANVLTNPPDMALHLTDWTGRYRGDALCVCRPGTTEEVAAVVRHCIARAIPVIPQGGNTNSVAGAIPEPGGRGVVVSLSRLTQIERVDTAGNVLIAGAGCTLQAVRQAAEDSDRLFPLTLSAQGSCQIGGNVSTNAGGTAALRYGSMRDLVLGLEAVLPDGRIWNGLRTLRKDNSGYDLKSLYIGAEGTLGIVTRVALKLVPRPSTHATAFVALPSPDAAVALFDRTRAAFGADIEAFELFSGPQLSIIARHVPGTATSFAPLPPWAALVEIAPVGPAPDLTDRLTALLADALHDGLVTNAIPAASAAQSAAFWKIRHSVSEANRRHGMNYTHDTAVPVAQVPAFLARADRLIADRYPEATRHSVTHLGDGNVHFTAIFPETCLNDPGNPARLGTEVAEIIHDLAVSLGGTFAAEHGIGRRYRAALLRHKSPEELDLFRTLKAAFDPQGLFNPGKLL